MTLSFASKLASEIANDMLEQIPLSGSAYGHPQFVMPPGHPFNLPIDLRELSLDMQGWYLLKQENKYPFVWGRIEYVDAFNRRRWTTFQLMNGIDGYMTFHDCAAGNEADREGRRRPRLMTRIQR